jgi:hypothetical protein
VPIILCITVKSQFLQNGPGRRGGGSNNVLCSKGINVDFSCLTLILETSDAEHALQDKRNKKQNKHRIPRRIIN